MSLLIHAFFRTVNLVVCELVSVAPFVEKIVCHCTRARILATAVSYKNKRAEVAASALVIKRRGWDQNVTQTPLRQ